MVKDLCSYVNMPLSDYADSEGALECPAVGGDLPSRDNQQPPECPEQPTMNQQPTTKRPALQECNVGNGRCM